jgi:hypothetical protein
MAELWDPVARAVWPNVRRLLLEILRVNDNTANMVSSPPLDRYGTDDAVFGLFLCSCSRNGSGQRI